MSTTAGATAQNNDELFARLAAMENHCPETVLATREGVAYGAVAHKTYFSVTCGMERGYNILIPADYDGHKTYPVLYLLHGIFGNEFSFTSDPLLKVKELFTNLAADGKAVEMIVVFPDMFARTDKFTQPSFSDAAVACYDNFINDLVTDLMPHINQTYKVKAGRQNTAICGFSMGGRETLFIGLSRPDLFAYIGAIAPAPGLVPAKDWAMQHKGQLSESDLRFAEGSPLPNLLMVCCGTVDKTVGTYPASYHGLFEKNGVAHFWYEVQGADHDNKAIQSGLYHFVQVLFK